MKTLLIASAFTTLVTLGILGCDEADETIDCAQICSKYNDCIDDDVDQTECIDQCEDKADRNDDAADAVDDCENCLDGTSCVEATFQCGIQCAPFLP
jgi:hypothetical protein